MSKRTYPDARFTLVGHAPEGTPECQDVEGWSTARLSTEQYAARARTLSHSVWVGDSKRYRLTASAAFLDSLAYLKPLLYLNNAFIRGYARSMGNIGTGVSSYEELRTAVLDTIRNHTQERYHQQVQALRAGRERFRPEQLAADFRQLVLDALSRN